MSTIKNDLASYAEAVGRLINSDLLSNHDASESKKWAQFYYDVYCHSSWQPHRNNCWPFANDSCWRRELTINLNYLPFYEYAHSASINTTPEFGAIDIPLAESNKGVQLVNLNIKDSAGNKIMPVPWSSCAFLCLQIIEGALYREIDRERAAKQKQFNSKNKPDPSEDDIRLVPLNTIGILWRTIQKWLAIPDLPKDDRGNPILMEESDCDERLCEAIRRFCNEAEKNPLEKDVQEGDLYKAFLFYYAKSESFRYFIRLYSFKRLIFARINIKSDRFKTITYTVNTIANIYNMKYRGGVFGYLPIALELDDTRFGEMNHTSVYAPENMCFVNAKYYWSYDKHHPEESWEFSKMMDHETDDFFFIQDRSGFYDQKGKTLNGSHLKTVGSHTQQVITTDTKMAWVQGENSFRTTWHEPIDSKGIPSSLFLEGVLSPVLGKRAWGYAFFYAFAFFIFLLYSIFPDSFNKPNDFLSISVLTALATVAITYIVSLDKLSFMQQRASRTARVLFYFGLIVFFFVIVALCCMSSNPNGTTGYIQVTSLIGLILIGGIGLLHLIWCLVHWNAQLKTLSGKNPSLAKRVKILEVKSQVKTK